MNTAIWKTFGPDWFRRQQQTILCLDKEWRGLYNSSVRSRSWRNRHTRTFEGRVQQWVRVQVPSTALLSCIMCRIFLPSPEDRKNPDVSDRFERKMASASPEADAMNQVEMRGVEPLSENPSDKLSPSAFRGLISPGCRPRTNCSQGSFIITDTGTKLGRYSFPAIMTPVA